jgi:hypothetical protein
MNSQDLRYLQEAYMEVVENQQLDEISQKTATSAYARSRSNEFEGADSDHDIRRTDNLEKHIRRKFGDKAAEDADRHADSMTFGRTDPRTGKRQPDPTPRIEKNRKYRTTKAGKMHRQDQAKLKRDLEYNRSSRNEQVDIYDIILSHLLDEGYAETPEAAETIMVHMSEDWRESIVSNLID